MGTGKKGNQRCKRSVTTHGVSWCASPGGAPIQTDPQRQGQHHERSPLGGKLSAVPALDSFTFCCYGFQILPGKTPLLEALNTDSLRCCYKRCYAPTLSFQIVCMAVPRRRILRRRSPHRLQPGRPSAKRPAKQMTPCSLQKSQGTRYLGR